LNFFKRLSLGTFAGKHKTVYFHKSYKIRLWTVLGHHWHTFSTVYSQISELCLSKGILFQQRIRH